MHISRGEIVALIGANGAGKTTVLNTVAGVHRPTEGNIIFDGHDIGGRQAADVVRLGLSLVPEGRQLFGAMSVRDNLMLGAYARLRFGKEALAEDLRFVYDVFPVLLKREHQKSGTLSGGEQQMLALGRAMMARPSLLLLDEPSTGLSPVVAKEIFAVLQELNRKGLTILLVEQNARMALAVSRRGYVMETGRIILEGESAQLSQDKEVQRAYLGKGYRQIQDQ
jgi:branched-chain amino acid transport system ATP-binding protein